MKKTKAVQRAPDTSPLCSGSARFLLDPESGFIFDHKTKRWLTTITDFSGEVLNELIAFEEAVGDGLRRAPVGGSAWLLASEELPELLQIVWLWDDERGPWIGGRGVDGDGWVWCSSYNTIWHNGKSWDGDLIHDDDYQPTHWMPLPDLPNDKDQFRREKTNGK